MIFRLKKLYFEKISFLSIWDIEPEKFGLLAEKLLKTVVYVYGRAFWGNLEIFKKLI